MTEGRLPDQKAFINDFVTAIIVFPDEKVIEVRIRKMPHSVLTEAGFYSLTVQLAGPGPFRPLS